MQTNETTGNRERITIDVVPYGWFVMLNEPPCSRLEAHSKKELIEVVTKLSAELMERRIAYLNRQRDKDIDKRTRGYNYWSSEIVKSEKLLDNIQG